MYLRLVLATILACSLALAPSPSLAQAVTQIIGAPVRAVIIASGITTNTTSGVVAVVAGSKTLYGEVVCTAGVCAQTQAIYGTFYPTAVNGILLCTLTLSGTTRAQDACSVATFAFPWIYVITTATSGTAATGAVHVGH